MPRRFKLDIELGNDAMKTAFAVSTALVQVANKLRKLRSTTPGTSAKIMDENGNSVGSWEFYKDDPGDDA